MTGLTISNGIYTPRIKSEMWRITENALKFLNNPMSRLEYNKSDWYSFEGTSVLFLAKEARNGVGPHNRVIIVGFPLGLPERAHEAHAFESRKGHASWRKKSWLPRLAAEDFFHNPMTHVYAVQQRRGHVPAVMTSFATKFNLQRPPAVLNFRFPFRLILSRIASSRYVQRAYDFRDK